MLDQYFVHSCFDTILCLTRTLQEQFDPQQRIYHRYNATNNLKNCTFFFIFRSVHELGYRVNGRENEVGERKRRGSMRYGEEKGYGKAEKGMWWGTETKGEVGDKVGEGRNR